MQGSKACDERKMRVRTLLELQCSVQHSHIFHFIYCAGYGSAARLAVFALHEHGSGSIISAAQLVPVVLRFFCEAITTIGAAVYPCKSSPGYDDAFPDMGARRNYTFSTRLQ
jgi:hypothetical protein